MEENNKNNLMLKKIIIIILKILLIFIIFIDSIILGIIVGQSIKNYGNVTAHKPDRSINTEGIDGI